jgi:6-phosphogluconolactonase
MDNNLRMIVASDDGTGAGGIYVFDLNRSTGEMRLIGKTQDIDNCLYLSLHPIQPVLYATGSFHKEAQIHAFHIEPDGGLTLINRQPTNGYESCYVSLGGGNRYALVVNYTGAAKSGSIVSFPLQSDGGVQPHAMQIQLTGMSVHPQRQDASHPHMIIPSTDDRYVLIPDLGTDKVMIYRLDHDGQLHPHTQTHIDIKPGSGPRHLAFYPRHPIFYVMSELEPILTVVAYDATGRFDIVDTYPTLPHDDAVPVNLGADIHVTPSGRFLYASNRGHNSLVIYAIDSAGKSLSYVGHQSTLGDWPRAFVIDPLERILVAANQRTNDLYTFYIDASSGRLSPTGHKATVPGPTCVKFAK